MKRITLAVLALSLLASIALTSCKKAEETKPAEQAPAADQKDVAKDAAKDAPAAPVKK
jgi:hypothetical protein